MDLKGHSAIWWGMVITAILFILFPIIMTMTNLVMDWTGGSGGNISQFTGLESIVSIAPLVIFVFFVFGNVAFTTYGAIKASGGKLSTALLISLVMIAVGFLFYMLVLDGADALLDDANIGDYTGLESVVSIAPLIIFVSYIFGAVGTTAYAASKKIKGQ